MVRRWFRKPKQMTEAEIKQSLERLVQMGLCEKKVNADGETEYPFTEKGRRIASLINRGSEQGYVEMADMFKRFIEGGGYENENGKS